MEAKNYFKALFAFFFPLFTTLFLPLTLAAISPIKFSVLSCEYLQNPLGIETKMPRFSWTMLSSVRNQYQSAYEIIVSEKMNEIEQFKGTVWASGKVASNKNILIDYKGTPLKSFTKYFWRVKIYDAKGEASEWSKINSFETAMLLQEYWKAKCISDGSKQPAREEDYYKEGPMPLFRKEFSSKKNVVAARLYISGV